ncbi:SurA N-terminal domain-containing protein [Rhodobacter ferrooxidans]|uniref:Putative peptidyl-prolyl cis-trans isomerse D n=1 Tax=Rhodobacter ferrooxidans TaxID=371731 RepID=C8S5B5_9RHOB|nr:SurA N-terminal domain-containing protein [Rhodobacter sp. SW2]EEW23848.1 putative peptidyl-prolyl cis-trans isomerse D [Rhodobacter sp. SW2]
MAKAPEPDAPVRKRKGASTVVWALMALLMLGLGGFGVTNFGSGVSEIGAVGDRKIDVNQYARALQQELAAFSAQVGSTVSLQEGIERGIDRQVRQQLLIAAALDNEADRIGLSVGDARVARELAGMAAFQGAGGSFDRETYRATLKNNSLTEADFEGNLRDDLSRSLLQGAVSGGIVAPAALTDTLYSFIAERRGFSLLRLTEADLKTAVPAPTEADLQAHYTANLPAFTKPEARRITYAALFPATLATTMPVDEAALKALYDSRIDEFVQPEKRLVERLVYPTEADATAARAKLDAGTPFETLVAERGLTLEAIDMGDVGKADLGAAGEAVFALTEPGVVGPLATDLGPALLRMNAILAAQNVSFEDARDTLVPDMQQDAARRAIGDKLEAIDDALAGGASLEDLGKEFGMAVASIDFVPEVPAEGEDAITGYPAFREAATQAVEGDFAQTVQLDDGGVVALRLDEIVPAAPIPLDQAQEAVTASWRKAAVAQALAARAAEIKAAVEGGDTLADYGTPAVTPEIARDGFVEGAPADILSTVFKLPQAGVGLVQGPDFTGLVQVDSITPAAASGEAADALKASLNAQIEQALAQDAFLMFSNTLAQTAGIRLDEAAINAVHAQFR